MYAKIQEKIPAPGASLGLLQGWQTQADKTHHLSSAFSMIYNFQTIITDGM
jgi:hypothetical protein